jgi:hypothetical protein
LTKAFLQSIHSRDFSLLRRRFYVVSFEVDDFYVSCLIFVRCDCVVVSAFWLEDEIRAAVGWRFFLSRFGLISKREWMLLGFGALF